MGMHPIGTRRLRELAAALSGLLDEGRVPDVPVAGISTDTRSLSPGQIFVAIRGTAEDGHAYIGEALRQGAAAVVAERGGEREGSGRVLRVRDARAALAELAAAWHGRPAERLRLVGITGSLGKTSTLSMLEAVLTAAGMRVGTIGSLGIRLGDVVEQTRLTTPPPLALHEALARFARRHTDLAAMEVTSHALVQQRIHGLAYALGIFTNLVALEHRDYHGSFRGYVEAKQRFFDHVRPGAPLVYTAADRVVRTLVKGRGLEPVSCGPCGRVSVRVERLLLDRGGARVVMHTRAPLPLVGGGAIPPVEIPIELRVLGRPNITNAVLAAAGALCLGAAPEAVQDALSAFCPPPRRMQIVDCGRFTVLDDTVGHPDSIGAVFDVAAHIPHRRLHVIYAIRGRRGEEINLRDAEAVAIWGRRLGLATLLVTASAEATDAVNRVSPAERDAFLEGLRRHGATFRYFVALDAAIEAALDTTRDGDLLLLLGAQGMDRGADYVRERVE